MEHGLGVMFDGLQRDAAAEVEAPMIKELGMVQALQKPGAVNAAINWYRWG